MNVEIWSDVICPFCYIGKRKFENALAQFQNKDQVNLIWKSFQLAPDIKTEPGKNLNQFLAEHKGISVAQAEAMNNHVTQLARQVGLVYNFDCSVVANSLNAHGFLHFAKHQNKQTEAEEILFRTYFTDGKNIDDIATLVELGAEIGLDTSGLKPALENNTYAEDVHSDIYEAQQLGIRGVPFFVFNRKYAVSGAQESTTFLEVLEKSFSEWKQEHSKPQFEVIQGQNCSVDGECE